MFPDTLTPRSYVNPSDFKYITRVFKMLQAKVSVSAGQARTRCVIAGRGIRSTLSCLVELFSKNSVSTSMLL